jgi:hypothetical protein
VVPPRLAAMPWAPNAVVNPAAYSGHVRHAGPAAMVSMVSTLPHPVRDVAGSAGYRPVRCRSAAIRSTACLDSSRLAPVRAR